MENFVGVDIAEQTFDFAAPEKKGQLSNDTQGFEAFLKLLPEQAWVVMEASGPYHLQLAFFLYEHQVRVSVVNPLQIRRYAQMRMQRAKTDRKDAELIAEYGQSQRPELWKPQDKHLTQIRQMLTVLEQLQKQRTATQNQRQALSLSPDYSPEALQALDQILDQVQKVRAKLEKQLEELVEQECSASFHALQSIPGIGPKTAALLIAITGNFKRFTHIKQLVSYVGLSPRVYESGTSVRGRGHICKMGMGQVRKLLYMCSWSAKRFNTSCREFYERLKAKGKPERVIKVALANKLLRIAFALGKKQAQFDKNYAPKIAF